MSPDAEEANHPPVPLLRRRTFQGYLGCLASFWLPGGMITVLLPWLMIVELQATAPQLGLAQMALQLPVLLLIIPFSLLADRGDPRRLLSMVHLLAPLPLLALALTLATGEAGLGTIVVFAIACGTCAALAMPARDLLLSHVAADRLQRAVGLSMGLQFTVQILGYGAAASADQVGAVPLLLLAALVMASGWFAVRRLPDAGRREQTAAASGSLLAGVRITLRSATLRGPMLLAAATGVFHGGSFMVLLPLLIRDAQGGSSIRLGAAFTCFMLGTLGGIALLQMAAPLRRPGQVLLMSLALGSLALALLPLSTSTPYLLPLVAAWGLCGGIGMVMSRSIVQQAAPASHRGRVLGVYSLLSFGGLPLGSLLLGYLAALVGTASAAQLSAVLVLLLTATVTLTTPLVRASSA